MLRREVVLGGALTILTGASDACCQSMPPGRPRGCMIPDQLAPVFFARASSEHQTYREGTEPIEAKSGRPAFDVALAHTLSDMTKQFGVLPAFAYYEDGDYAQALATKSKKLGRADGTILFGVRMLRETLVEVDSPEIAVTAVCAHEFGHIVQFAYNLTERLLKGQKTPKRAELHADFLAGYYAGLRWLRDRDYQAVVFGTKLSGKGDYDVNSDDHHGTPKERGDAVVHGFLAAKDDRLGLDNAIRAGMQYVQTL